MATCRIVLAAVLTSSIGSIGLARQAVANVGDERTTLTYLRADRRFQEEVISASPRVQLAASGFTTKTIAECPAVVAHAPLGDQLAELREESREAVTVASSWPYQRPALTFANDIKHLRWRGRTTTMLVHAYAVGLRAAAPHPPPLCVELSEWALGGYSTIPPETTRFLKEARTGFSEAGETQILRLLTLNASPRIRTTLAALKALEFRADVAILGAIEPAAEQLQQGLGLIPSSPNT